MVLLLQYTYISEIILFQVHPDNEDLETLSKGDLIAR